MAATSNDEYKKMLKREFGFSEIVIDQISIIKTKDDAEKKKNMIRFGFKCDECEKVLEDNVLKYPPTKRFGNGFHIDCLPKNYPIPRKIFFDQNQHENKNWFDIYEKSELKQAVLEFWKKQYRIFGNNLPQEIISESPHIHEKKFGDLINYTNGVYDSIEPTVYSKQDENFLQSPILIILIKVKIHLFLLYKGSLSIPCRK